VVFLLMHRRYGDTPDTGKLQEVAGLPDDSPDEGRRHNGCDSRPGTLDGQEKPLWGVEDYTRPKLLIPV
jgi:hypothetical protein